MLAQSQVLLHSQTNQFLTETKNLGFIPRFFFVLNIPMKIRCSTLFNITKTGVNTRREPHGLTPSEMAMWNTERKKQANYETMLQVINMRAQPEDITDPTQTEITFIKDDQWGYLFEEHKLPISCWQFEFTVSYGSIFNDGVSELGSLITDCNGVPMLTGLGEWDKLPNHLDTSKEQCNIVFEVVNEENEQEAT